MLTVTERNFTGSFPASAYCSSLQRTNRAKERCNAYATKLKAAGWEAIEDWKPKEIAADEAKMLGRLLREGVPPPKGEVDMVLGPEITGIICHESCGHPQEADRILGREAAQAGESYIKPDMLGHRIGTENVTIIDDPTLPNSYGFYRLR